MKHCEQQPNRNFSSKQCAVIAGVLALLFLAAVSVAQAQNFQVLHSFTNGDDGAIPLAGLTIDRAGNLYGTASGGGKTNDGCVTYGCGVAFRLKHSNSGWILTPLYVFQGGQESGLDGANPEARMVFAADGTLYGTTSDGGGNSCNTSTCGTVFKLSPPATACKSALCGWDETIVYRFTGTPHAGLPVNGPLVFDQAGNLYGTAIEGPGGNGVIYELTSSGGTWSEDDLSGGDNPFSGVIFDTAGNLYGANQGVGYGGIYQLVHSGSGWTMNPILTVLTEDTGGPPEGGLIFDNSGNLYGSMVSEGPNGGGTVFELSAGTWNFNLLYGFSGSTGPKESLSMDSAGNLYGTTWGDGAHSYGNVFKLTPSANGWAYTDLYDFTGGSDGRYPVSNVVIDAQGNLYGTTSYGGAGPCTSMYYGNGCGTVWEITP
ncbi:MAG: choice-of-anchor tandem repeat GloVer-containing protein [Candidatus Korobacteraceae bacterium]